MTRKDRAWPDAVRAPSADLPPTGNGEPRQLDIAVRCDMVRLAHRSDREPWQVLEVANAYAEWVLNGTKPAQTPG